MSPKTIPKEAKQAVESLLDAPEHYTYREIAKLVTHNVHPISRQTVCRIKQARSPRKTRLQEKHEEKRRVCRPLAANIEESVLISVETRRGRKSRSEIVNELLEAWLSIHAKDALQLILQTWVERRKRFRDRRHKYENKRKTAFSVDKTVLAKLKEMQNEVNKRLKELMYEHDYVVQLVRPNSKMTLEDWLYTLQAQGLLETKKHRPVVSLAEIVNDILRLELQSVRRY